MRTRLRSLLVSVGAAGAMGMLLATPAASQVPDAGHGTGSLLSGSLVGPAVDGLLRGEGAVAARQARRANPVAVARRSATRAQYEGATPSRAASLARAAFPTLAQPADGMPTVARNQRILRYATNHAAEVSFAGGSKGMIESIAPIAVTVGHRHVPFDLALTETGAGFVPIRSAVHVLLPKQLQDGGVSLPEIGTSLTPADTHGAPLAGSQGQLDGAAVLWRQADRKNALDLASVAKPTGTGVDLSTLLLSQRSPDKLYFRLGMPAGTHLRQNATGSVQILRGAALLATVTPVSAEDAEGTSVPVSMSAHGRILVVSVDATGDYLYPIAVDPEIEINDSQLVETSGAKKTNWEFHTSSAHFEGHSEKGVERLETKGVSTYGGGEIGYWGYQTQGVSHIYEIKVIDSAHNKGHKVESFLEFVGPGGTKETERKLSNEFLNPEYENKEELAFCASNPSKPEEIDPPACGPTFGKANNVFHFEQAATGTGSGFSDSMTQGIISIAEPSGTHSTTSYNTSSPTIEVEVEGLSGKEKVKRANALQTGATVWLSKLSGAAGGAIELKAADTGIGVSATKLEYESAAGVWTPLEEHKYLAENGCRGVQCYPTHGEAWTLIPTLPDGAQKLRYRAQEAISGTESLTSEGKATVKVDTKKPHGLIIGGLPGDGELSERPYGLTLYASDGEGSTVPSSGIKSIALFVDGKEVGTAGGSCTVAAGECTASNKFTVNGAELGAGKHGLVLVSIDNAGNEARFEQKVAIRHSTPVALGPGSVDLQSGDFALGATDVSMGSGLTIGRNYSSRDTNAGGAGPLGPEWTLSLGNAEGLQELPSGDVLLIDSSGRQTIFAALGEGKFESPPGDSNLELTLEENKTTKEKLAYYLKNPGAHTSVKFTRPVGTKQWVPSVQEGAVSSDTVTYRYETTSAFARYEVPGSGTYPEGAAGGPDGNVWFVEHFGNKVGRITPTGSITTYATASGAEPRRITSGTDGNMWFSENAKKVGRITPSGKITEFSTYNKSESVAIATGPSGWIWYAEPVERSISAINPSNTAETLHKHTFPIGTTPGEMALGPDGNMWVVLGGVNKIAKVTASGATTEYALPAGSKPVSITAGPGNSMWFTNVGTKKVGKITMTGEVSEYAMPAEIGGTPAGIAKGPDGNVWFTTQDHAGKVTPSGEVSEYTVGHAEGEEFITAGPDGNMWLVNRSYVGSIAPPGEIAIPVEVRAASQAGVSCSYTSEPTEMNPGCRALVIHYWGEQPDEIWKVMYVAYDPSTKHLGEKPVQEYDYDSSGRLTAAWDPRIGGKLATTYGYDEEGHVTAMSLPGQEPWAFTYGAIAGDKGTGRLLKASRAPASAELWKGGEGEAVANTAAPAISGAATEGVRLAVSRGTWSGSPISYGYQWKRCQASGACEPIAGATNPNYTSNASDVGDTLTAEVTATNAGGSAKVASAATAAVVSNASAWTEYSLPESSGPRDIAPGPVSNAMWFTDYTSSKIGKTTTAGAITEYALPASSGPEGIVKGPDENMWFAEYKSSKIGKITSTGTITEYALPAESHPKTIVSGPDGKLWFTEVTTNKIGKITTAGTITEYALPAGSSPIGIASGPDGNLWFTESDRDKIGKITTAGTITEYALPSGSSPNRITVGPDGNLWFTDKESNKVGKITTSGTINEYEFKVFGWLPEHIASAGGYLWVTNKGGGLSRVTTSGAITELTPPSSLFGLAANALGELWYAANSSNKIGKLQMSSLTEGEAKSPEPGSTLAYNIPVTGSSAPYNLSEGKVAKWGQVDDPVEATAIFPPDEPQGWPTSGYKRAAIHYLDEHGREVNVASPSTNPNGSIATTEYNEFNDVIRTLTPDNRLAALAAGAESAEKSKLLDTQNTYNGEGKKESEVEEAGTRLIDVLGPQHMIKYRAGGETKETLARHHSVLIYNQGAPGGEKYDLVTERYDLAQLVNHEEVEVRTTKSSYSGQGNLGWKLRAPTSVTVDPEGSKLTTTTEYNPTTGQVTEVRGAGAETTLSYASKFGETGTEPGKLKNPWGVAVNSEGKLWVVDSANSRVEEFSSSGSYITKFGEAGSGNGQLKEPEGIALDSAGHIWIADTGNNRVEEFSSAGAFMASVGSLGTESGKFKAPTALAFDPKGNMWVADGGNNRIEKFDKEAKYSSEFGSAGTEPGKLAAPMGIAVDSGEHIWVADTGNNRIQEFSTTGSLLKRFGGFGAGEGQLNAPIDLKIDSLGNIWTVDSNNNRAESFSPAGAYVTQIGFKGTEPGQLTGPRSLAFDATGKAWVSDSANNRMEQWSKDPNAHDQKTIYYSTAANSEYATCGSHPEWAGLTCETLPAKQPELMGLPKLPVTVTTYNVYNEPETIIETFGSTTRTKKESYDFAGRKS